MFTSQWLRHEIATEVGETIKKERKKKSAPVVNTRLKKNNW